MRLLQGALRIAQSKQIKIDTEASFIWVNIVLEAESNRPALAKRHELTDRPKADEPLIADVVSAAEIKKQKAQEQR